MTEGYIKIDDLESAIKGLSTVLSLAEDDPRFQDWDAIKDAKILYDGLTGGLQQIVATNTWVDFEYVDGYEINKRGFIRTKENRPQGLFSYRHVTKPDWDYVYWELMDVDGKSHQFKVFTPKGLNPIVVPVDPGYVPFRNKGL